MGRGNGRFGISLILLLAFAPAAEAQSFDHAAFDSVLSSYVVRGGVDYKGLEADRTRLDAYVARLGDAAENNFRTWPRGEQIAFLINAYNAITLVQVIDHYPIRRSMRPAALVRPANSVSLTAKIENARLLAAPG